MSLVGGINLILHDIGKGIFDTRALSIDSNLSGSSNKADPMEETTENFFGHL
jgi:hypothetical protein